MAMNPTIAANISPNADTLITIKVQLAGETRRFKLALRDLGANTLPDKVCFESSLAALRVSLDWPTLYTPATYLRILIHHVELRMLLIHVLV